jgi:hypothetical protein
VKFHARALLSCTIAILCSLPGFRVAGAHQAQIIPIPQPKPLPPQPAPQPAPQPTPDPTPQSQ